MSKPKSKQQEALQLLDDLDSFTPIPEGAQSAKPPASAQGSTTANEGEAEALAFLDEITRKSAEPTRVAHLDRPASRSSTPTLRKSTERVKLGGSSLGSTGGATPPTSASVKSATPEPAAPGESAPANSGGGWGWGSVWNTASTALQQARSVVEEQAKNLPKNEQARKWGEDVMGYAKSAQLDKLGQDFRRVGLSTLTDILNAVAPPISEHEVIQVWLSHDMKGYDGIETLVYRSLARVMEQVEGGDLIVNKGEESRPKEEDGNSGRDLNAVEGYDTAVKLAQANLDELIATKNAKKPQEVTSVQVPTIYSYVYLRVQPYLSSYSLPSSSKKPEESSAPAEQSVQQHLQFLLYLSDPSHNLVHSTITQAVPGAWLAVWDQYDWVEDLVAEALRVGIEVVGQEYIVSRMGWAAKGGDKEAGIESKGTAESDGEQDQTEES
ncbi:hypothetical protein K435DRAFT_833442 [Dendrothele bispora CBS 962.96]|uniref:Maintenance of telomere capping protein 1 n=1 Tax=Dendrothele bispora (strain CBS 962.96) TaxID=1314807 RepID=A0A4V4HIR3_DENBC|nr:hypothetical protein K435DRAFT_833442 [Dendrothele bispora CBS 962.96]